VYPAKNLFVPTEHGRLEAIWKEPRVADGEHRRGAALVLHPHPLHGGTMHNKVVFRAARALNDAGLATLRINFRGVGASTGTHDYAKGELDDARAGLDYLTQSYPQLPLTLAGFSFGARVGLEVGIADGRVKFLVSIGTPVNMYDFDFLRECRKPVLFVHGSRDEFGDVGKLKSLAAGSPPEAEARVEVIEGAGHFFDETLDELTRIITTWAQERTKRMMNTE
jgi:hypothetical protein